MADVVDIATDLIEETLANQERAARSAARPEFDMSFDGVHCVDCEIEVPAVRRILGKVRCVECQEDHEKRAWAHAQRARDYDEV